MLRKLKQMISTRNVMLNTPPMGEYRHITDEEVKEVQKVMLQIIKDVAEVCEKHGVELSVPAFKYCTDNAAMIGAAAYPLYKDGKFADLDLNATSRDEIY